MDLDAIRDAGARRLVRESAKTRDEEQARRVLERKLRDAANAQEGLTAGVEEPKHRRVTVSVLFADLLAEYRRRQTKGLDREESRLRNDGPLVLAFGNRKAAAIERRDVVAYVEARRTAGMKNATINKEVNLLKAAFRLGIESGRVVSMPKFPAMASNAYVWHAGVFAASTASQFEGSGFEIRGMDWTITKSEKLVLSYHQ